MGVEFTFDADMFLDLGDLKQAAATEEEPQAVEAEQENTEELMADLGLDAETGEEAPVADEEEVALQEILDMLSEDTEEEVLEEELIVDMGHLKRN